MTVAREPYPISAAVPPAEHAEGAALTELHAAADASLVALLGLELHRVDGALVSLARRDPSILLNRVVGLGLEAPARPDTPGTLRRIYREAGVSRFFLHHGERSKPAELVDWLREAGLVPHRRWMKFVRDPEVSCALDSGLRVERIGPDHADSFADIVASGFDLTPEGGRLVSRLATRPGWHLYLSFDGDRPLGGAALYVIDGIGWFDWAATRPEARGRGSQQALLARRIADARELGCRLLCATTGEAVPGDPQHSYHNLLKAGFREAYLRDNYVPAE